MKVSELIELLSECDPDATVMIGQQPAWPFENAIDGIAVRADFAKAGDKDDEADAGDSEDRKRANDVFIVEGAQLRYGSKAMWDREVLRYCE